MTLLSICVYFNPDPYFFSFVCFIKITNGMNSMKFWLSTFHCFAGCVKAKIITSRDKCSGNVEVYYEDKWLPVCMQALSDTGTQNKICEEMKCGQAVKTLDYVGPTSASPFISQIDCDADGKSLRDCTIISKNATCTPGGLQCSGMWNDFVSHGSLSKCLHYPYTLPTLYIIWAWCLSRKDYIIGYCRQCYFICPAIEILAHL